MWRRCSTLGLLFLGACSTWRALQSSSGPYHQYVDSHVKQQEIFDRGQELLTLKVLPVTKAFESQLLKLTPVPYIKTKNDARQIIMAISVSGKVPANLPNWELKLGGRKASDIFEVTDDEAMSREFYYAYPFYRVVEVDFTLPRDGATKETLDVLSPYGKMSFDLDYAETEDAP